MNILYTRISTLDQRSDRQIKNAGEFDLLIEDKCSGAIPFFDREGGKKIQNLLLKNQITMVSVHQIDRLGRNLLDILNTINYFNKKKVSINFIQQGLITLNKDKTENQISKLIISVLGVVAEMERNLIKERQLEGIAIAKARGVYTGRKKGTSISTIDFLNKSNNKKAVELINKGYKLTEVAKITGLHQNTITKINKIVSTIKLHLNVNKDLQ